MVATRARTVRQTTLLQRYGDQLGTLVGHRRNVQALQAARRQAEQSAEVARLSMLSAEAANRAKSAFLANMSHELRTPLNAVIGFSEIMMNDQAGPAEMEIHRDHAQAVHSAGRHLLELVESILDLARIEAGQLDLHEDMVDVAASIRSALTMIGRTAEKAGLSVRQSLPQSLPPIKGDQTKIRQILINLLSNAVKFTPQGGAITVEVQPGKDGGLAIQISDTGIGIAEDDMAKALTPFGQVDSGLSRKYQGSGLGLPISKALAEMHGGSLTIDSEPGVGTTVTVRLPGCRRCDGPGPSAALPRHAGAGETR